MLNVLVWFIAVEVMGLAVLPVCYYLLPTVKDRGYSVSKPLGILIVGYLSWILSVLHILPSVQITVAALVVAVGALAWWRIWSKRQELLSFLIHQRTCILIAEGVFLFIFLIWVIYHAYNPAINHTEQPMDFAFLNASVRSDVGSPEDPWLRGESISYYYFGYWMMGMLTKLTGIASGVSYNLSLALVPALGATAIFGLVYNMVRVSTKQFRYAVVAGVASAVLLVGTANLEGVFEYARANQMGSQSFWDWIGIEGMDGPAPTLTQGWQPAEFWWWWRASRVISSYEDEVRIDSTIQEFPLFSYILGDLHPHVMSVPFTLLFLVFCWHLYRSPIHVGRNLGHRTYLTIGLVSLVLGGLAFANMWDLPVFAAVLVGTVAVSAYSTHDGSIWAVIKNTVPLSVAIIGLAMILILPYLLGFTSQVSGIAPVEDGTSRPIHLLIVWGIFLVAVTPFILGVFWRTTVRNDWPILTLLSFLVGFGPYLVWLLLNFTLGGISAELSNRFIHVLPFALLIAIATYSMLWFSSDGEAAAGKVFALLLSTVGLLLIMGPELLYVNDSFSGDLERMNTVFKLYYQGWVVLAAASGFAIYYWSSIRERASGLRLLSTNIWAVLLAVLLVGSGYYSVAAVASAGNSLGDGPTLNGLENESGRESAEYRAILVLLREASSNSAILEAVGGDYSNYGRVSASTGIPTVLGWPGHQLQWRGSDRLFVDRESDVATIYETENVDEAKALLYKYRVDFVYVGILEKGKYSANGLAKFNLFMETIFDEDGITLYRKFD